MFALFIAQTSTAGQALDTLSNAIEVSQKTVESWNLLWFNTFNTQESALWIALVKLGLILAGMSVIYLAVTSGKEIIEKQSWYRKLNLLPLQPLPLQKKISTSTNLLASIPMFHYHLKLNTNSLKMKRNPYLLLFLKEVFLEW